MFITLLIIKLIFFCSINFNIHIFAEIKKQKTMYQVIISKGLESRLIEVDSLNQANAEVLDYAHQAGINHYYDSDGWAYAFAGKYHCINIQAFIFQII